MRTHTTDSQRDAARTNGAHSQGPITPEGKERSSQNATRHGLNSKAVVLANESQEAYDELLATIQQEWQPQGPTENDLVRDMADARWRLRRIKAIETAALDSEMFINKDDFEASFSPTTPIMRQADAFIALCKLAPTVISNLARYESRYERSYHRASKALTMLQQQRALQQQVEAEQQKSQNEPKLPPPAARMLIRRDIETPLPSSVDNSPLPEAFSWTTQFTRIQ